jgi:hypothetical protein
VMLNPAHRDAARVPPLVTRPFRFAECLHTPPIEGRYESGARGRAVELGAFTLATNNRPRR